MDVLDKRMPLFGVYITIFQDRDCHPHDKMESVGV